MNRYQDLEKAMKNKLRFIGISSIIFLFSIIFSVNAQDGLGGMPGTYLHMGVGAEGLSMGKAYTAIANDATAIYWNPAALATQNPYQVYFTHSILFYDTNFGYLGGSIPTRKLGTFGLGLVYLYSSEFDQRNELNEQLGSFGISDMAFLLSWSKETYYDVSVGINYKLVTQSILDYSGTGHGIDLGLKRRFYDRVDVGMMFMNLISPKMKLAHRSETYPMQFRMGAAMKFLDDKLLVSTEIAKIIDWESTYFNIGAEYTILNQYGFYHSFAVKYAFGGFEVNAKAFPDIFSPVGEQNISHIKLTAKTRSEISEWNFHILDTRGNIIRSFAEKGSIPEEIVWDGRDNSGALVEDGKFKYKFEIFTMDGESLESEGKLVTIDTQGPAGSLGQ
ncbi:MAG: PorV/PorQ family protein [Calditrichaceae bacterium]